MQRVVHSLLAAGLALGFGSSPTQALFVDFETTPGGGTPVDNDPFGGSYTDGTISVTFGWDTTGDLAIDLPARFEQRGDDDRAAYITGINDGNPSNNVGPDDANYSIEFDGGDWLIRRPRSGEGTFDIFTDRFLIVYSGGTRNAAGQLWDLDVNESWLITALDASNSVIATITMDSDLTGTPGCCTGPEDGTGEGDGRPSTFSFPDTPVDIAMIVIEYTSATGPNAGFGFDNFNATGATIDNCDDGVDNDGDGLIDFGEDPGCSDAADGSERDASLPCDDGLDNDSDGRNDFDPATLASPGDEDTDPAGQGDPVCFSPTFAREDSQCQDGVHNDGDSKMDYDGGRSIHGVAQSEPDPQCNVPWRDKEAKSGCGLGVELSGLLAVLLWLRQRRQRSSSAQRAQGSR